MNFSVKPAFKMSVAVAAALCAPALVHAVPIASPVVSGLNTKWEVVSPGVLGENAAADLNAVLAGNAANPGGNVELGKFGSSPATTLTGTVGGQSIVLSSLELTDWTANGDQLAKNYIQTSAFETFGFNLEEFTELPAALTAFYGTNAWKRVSDPNVSYVDFDSGIVKVGLAGFFDAKPVLQGLFPALAALVPDDSQASEVVKVTYAGNTEYLFGFTATPSGYASNDSTLSFTGNYEGTVQAVSEPASLALLGFGLIGLGATRKRRIAS